MTVERDKNRNKIEEANGSSQLIIAWSQFYKVGVKMKWDKKNFASGIPLLHEDEMDEQRCSPPSPIRRII